jgi:hypothetical protein
MIHILTLIRRNGAELPPSGGFSRPAALALARKNLLSIRKPQTLTNYANSFTHSRWDT